MPDTSTAGDIAEAIVTAEFLKAGFLVARPFSASSRYDLVVDAGGRLLRVQVKVASLCGWQGSKECVRFHCYSPRYAGGKFRGREAYREAADLFAAHSRDTGHVYVLPVGECPETDVWLRLTPTKANNQHGIRMAEDHTLEAWAARQSQIPST